MNQAVWAVAVWELRRFFKLRDQVIGFLIMVFLGGGVAALMALLGNREGPAYSSVVRLAILPESPALLTLLSNTTMIKVEPVAGRSEAELRGLVAKGDLDGLILMPTDGAAKAVAKQPFPWWQNAIGSYLTTLRQQEALRGKGWTPEQTAELLTPVFVELEVIDDVGQAKPAKTFRPVPTPSAAAGATVPTAPPATTPATATATTPREPAPPRLPASTSDPQEIRTTGANLLVGLMLYAVFVSLSFFFVGVTGEKRDRVTEQVVAAVSPQTWIDGKLLGITMAAVGSTAVFALGMLTVYLGFKAFKGELALPQLGLGPVEVALFLTSCMLGLAMWNCFFAATAATINDPNTSARSGLLFLALIPVFMVWMVTDRPDGLAMRVMMLVPLTAPAAIPARYMVGSPAAWEIALALVLLVATIWLFRRLAGKIFALGILMHGKEPSLREMWRWLREA